MVHALSTITWADFFQTWRQPDGEFGGLNNGLDIEMNGNSDPTFNVHVNLRVTLSIETSGAVPVPYVSLRKASAHDAIIHLHDSACWNSKDIIVLRSQKPLTPWHEGYWSVSEPIKFRDSLKFHQIWLCQPSVTCEVYTKFFTKKAISHFT